MDVDGIIVEGHEVLALHKYLINYKFDDLGTVYAGSPVIAAIQHRLYDELEAADPGTGWQEWRKADRHTHRVHAVREYLAGADPYWTDLDTEQRISYVHDLFAPLRPSTELVQELVAIDGERRRHPEG